MIIVKIAGGLGNQLFCLNKALEIRQLTNKVYLDLSQYERERYGRIYHFDNKLSELKVLKKSIKKFLNKTNKLLTKTKFYNIYEENRNLFNILNLAKSKKIFYLSGYWQEEVYPNRYNLTKLQKLFNENKVKDSNIVCVHFRTKEYEIKLDISYYKNALKLFDQDYEFHIYGDDINFLNNNIPKLFYKFNYKICNLDDIEAFEEMMTYKNYISSNSTYCWWSIILNKNNLGIVTTPEVWMKNKNYNIYRPKEWKIVHN
jgi:hypothetical protein